MAFFWRFRYEEPRTSEVIITSSAAALPLEATPHVNHVETKTINGAQQTAELAPPQETLNLVFPHLNRDDYEDLWNILTLGQSTLWTRNYDDTLQAGGLGLGLRHFSAVDELEPYSETVFKSWGAFYLAAVPTRRQLPGARFSIGLKLLEVPA